jgi:hypothetical protein
MPTFPRRTVLKSVAAAPVTIPTLDSSSDPDENLEPDIEQIMGYSRNHNSDVGLQTDSNQRLLCKYTSNHLFEIMDVKNLTIHAAYLDYPRVNEEPEADAIVYFYEFPDLQAVVDHAVFMDVYNYLRMKAERCFEQTEDCIESVTSEGNFGPHSYYIARAMDSEDQLFYKFYLQFLADGILVWDIGHTGDLDRQWFSIRVHQDYLRNEVVDMEKSVFTD